MLQLGNKSNDLTQKQTPGYVCSNTYSNSNAGSSTQPETSNNQSIYCLKEEELPIPCLNFHASATHTKTVVIQSRIRRKAAVEVETYVLMFI